MSNIDPTVFGAENTVEDLQAQFGLARDEITALETTPAPVTSVNTQTGAVVLDAGDVGADPAGSAAGAVASHNASPIAHPGAFEISGAVAAGVGAHNVDATAHAGLFEAAGAADAAVGAHNIDATAHAGAFDSAGTASSEVTTHNQDATAHAGTFEASGAVATHSALADGTAHTISGISGLQDALNGKEDTGVAAGLVSTHTGEATAAHAGTAVSVDPTGLQNLAATDINTQLAVAALDTALGDAEAALTAILEGTA